MDNFFETLKNLGPGRLAMMVLTFFGLIVFFIFIAARSSNPSMTLLYGDLSMSDATEIAAKLDASKIPYILEENGTKVSVSMHDVGKSRILLAQEGLPRNASMGYEIFDQKQRFGATSFEQNINKLRALEGELARTIGTIASVRNARVHLVLPARELFSRDTQPASASVFINVRNNAAMGREQIQAIQHLVAAAVPQLKATRVAIIDQNGDLLASGEDSDDIKTSALDGEDMRKNYERRLARSIEDMVGRIVGFGKVRANVTADLDFDVVSRNSESYDPEGQVVRSTQTITDESQDNTGSQNGTVSVENNLPGLGAATGTGNALGSSTSRTEEVTNFEISKTIESVVRSSGDVKKLSIAVLLDGAYEIDPNAVKPEGAADNWEAPRIYVARSQEQLNKITSLVKSAVGYDEDRGDVIEVINMPFAEVDTAEPLPSGDLIMGFPREDILGMAETLTLSIVAVLIILLVLRPLATHFTAVASSRAANDEDGLGMDPTLLASGIPGDQPQLAAPGSMGGDDINELEQMIDMSSVEGKVKVSSVQKISELITNHPNETVAVIRQWMSQES